MQHIKEVKKVNLAKLLPAFKETGVEKRRRHTPINRYTINLESSNTQNGNSVFVRLSEAIISFHYFPCFFTFTFLSLVFLFLSSTFPQLFCPVFFSVFIQLFMRVRADMSVMNSFFLCLCVCMCVSVYVCDNLELKFAFFSYTSLQYLHYSHFYTYSLTINFRISFHQHKFTYLFYMY